MTETQADKALREWQERQSRMKFLLSSFSEDTLKRAVALIAKAKQGEETYEDTLARLLTHYEALHGDWIRAPIF